MTHNHPSGGAFSFADLQRMMVIATPRGPYYFRAGDRLFRLMQTEAGRDKLLASLGEKFNSWRGLKQETKLRLLAKDLESVYGFRSKT